MTILGLKDLEIDTNEWHLLITATYKRRNWALRAKTKGSMKNSVVGGISLLFENSRTSGRTSIIGNCHFRPKLIKQGKGV